ncbi:MAG: DegT/DnrJ/EryC1/StrS family aminotransferase, partial [Lachnospiraceae bacterium]|nr:DegT/DnrJ/EryC1/StrS family aminotransferase [Lachnospiraceae bacterium]
KKFPSFIERRRHNWARLRRALAGTEDKLILPEEAPGAEASWFGFLISVREDAGITRNEVTRYLEDKGIQTRLLFSGNLIRHPAFDTIRGTDAYRVAGSLGNTDFIMDHTFWVGVYPGMTDEMTDYMAETIRAALCGEKA